MLEKMCLGICCRVSEVKKALSPKVSLLFCFLRTICFINKLPHIFYQCLQGCGPLSGGNLTAFTVTRVIIS